MVSVKDINALLPQTQCRECGYAGCEPYAAALAQGTTTIDRCPPGGVQTMKALAHILNMDPEPWIQSSEAQTRAPSLALIRESECIGCTKCIQACPVDAIIGSAKRMHAIIDTECTGCGLCVDPCPVDCIEMITLDEPGYDKSIASQHFEARKIRHHREEQRQQQLFREKNFQAKNTLVEQQKTAARQAYILEALERVKAKK